MSYHGDMIDAALSELPKLKDAAGLTYRRFVYQKLSAAAFNALGGAPWTVEAEVALRRLQLAADAAIDADPELQGIFDAVLSPPAPGLPPLPCAITNCRAP